METITHEELEFYQVVLQGEAVQFPIINTENKNEAASLAQNLKGIFDVENVKLDVILLQENIYFKLDKNNNILDEERVRVELDF